MARASRAVGGGLGSVRGGRYAGRLATFLCVVSAWVFFRAESVESAVDILRAMGGAYGVSLPRSWLAPSGRAVGDRPAGVDRRGRHGDARRLAAAGVADCGAGDCVGVAEYAADHGVVARRATVADLETDPALGGGRRGARDSRHPWPDSCLELHLLQLLGAPRFGTSRRSPSSRAPLAAAIAAFVGATDPFQVLRRARGTPNFYTVAEYQIPGNRAPLSARGGCRRHLDQQ